jgi:hypothetical protein
MRHFALLFLLFISSLFHSQSKKDQIQILTIQVDSLNQLLKKKDNKFTDLETKCAQKEVNLSTQISALNNQLSSAPINSNVGYNNSWLKVSNNAGREMFAQANYITNFDL